MTWKKPGTWLSGGNLCRPSFQAKGSSKWWSHKFKTGPVRVIHLSHSNALHFQGLVEEGESFARRAAAVMRMNQ
jgi:hypothetical protein